MKEFLDALRQLQPGDLIRVALVLGPVVASLWALIHWAYKTRLETVATSLELTRADRDSEIKRVRDALQEESARTVEHLKSEIETVRSQLEATKSELTMVRHDFEGFHELYETGHKDALWYWWQQFEAKYFRLRERRWREMRNDVLDREPRKARLLVLWEQRKATDKPER